MNKKIGILDSGIGGTTVLSKIKELLPKEDYVYYKDDRNNPYGEKSDDELQEIVETGVKFLLSNDCKIIVLACNTATTKCIKNLRTEFKNTIFIGTEPAIKVACDNNYKNIFVLATEATIESKRTMELVKQNKKDYQEITLIKGKGLANAIEVNNKKEITRILKNIKKQVKFNPDVIVLGCTHYPLIIDDIKYFFKNAAIIDGSDGVARQVKRLLEENNLLNSNGNGTVEYFSTKEKYASQNN